MDKQAIRERIWREMEERGIAIFPPPYGRIPNFINADKAAEKLCSMEIWKKAKAIKCNPDSPQKFVRLRALEGGKTVYMAVPRLKQEKCFIELHGRTIAKHAATIRGAFRYGKPVYPWEMKKVDLIVAGSVAVNKKGARVGKGGGYSDIEYAIAREIGIVDETTPVITTVHDIQLIDEEIPMKEHDVPVDYIITPTKAVKTEGAYSKPHGIIWEILDKGLPVLEILKKRKNNYMTREFAKK